MDLSSLNLLEEYRSDKCNLVDDFYVPGLSNSVLYQRSVGYFTSQSLALVAKGLSSLINNGGTMQLIASPFLSPSDIEAIEKGYEARQNVVTRAILREIETVEQDIINKRLGFLAKLIADNKLEIKIALVKDLKHKGLYHEKLGLFTDDIGNTVAFSGSANETEGGLYDNFEQIDVFCSWKESEVNRVHSKLTNFVELWNNSTLKLDVLPFPEAARTGLLRYVKYAPDHDPEVDLTAETEVTTIMPDNKPALPSSLELRPYQKEAITSWFKHNGSGIFEMATGTGKTITAFSLATLLHEKIDHLAVLIVCPYTHLVEQWATESSKFGFQPIVAYNSTAKWQDKLTHAIVTYNIGVIDHFCVITTNDSFMSKTFQESINRISRPTILMVDEVHHVGAAGLREHLPINVNYRLGLSATPDRWMDDEGTEAINSYFSPGVIFKFGLKEAIGKYLTEYFYYPHLVELTDDESELYYELTRKISKFITPESESFDLSTSGNEGLKMLLIKRAKLIGRARNKTDVLRELVRERKDSKYNIFYCGDEKVDGIRQLEEVMKMLGHDVGMRVHPFTSQENQEMRESLLHDFSLGLLQGLVAIRCLDEGVDVPATQTAYILASSTNPREFIQRRGRILRKHPDKKYAYIHDFIVIPRDLHEVQHLDHRLFNIERSLVRKELVRTCEFAKLAINGPQAEANLLPVKELYNLLDI